LPERACTNVQLGGGAANPDLLSDGVLDWLIDMPGAASGGLRYHRAATQPITREFSLKLEAE
jgi:hypothetical protein